MMRCSAPCLPFRKKVDHCVFELKKLLDFLVSRLLCLKCCIKPGLSSIGKISVDKHLSTIILELFAMSA